jgi:hypothetical protein
LADDAANLAWSNTVTTPGGEPAFSWATLSTSPAAPAATTAAPIIIIFWVVHIVTSSNLRCAKTLAEQLHSPPRTEIHGPVASWTTPSVTKNNPILMTLIGLVGSY